MTARLQSLLLALVLLVTTAPAAPATTYATPQLDAYRNPVSRDFADTFADPAIIKGKDGFWYSFGTSDPLREGTGDFATLPIARSRNLTDWTYVGDAFDSPQEVSWAAEDASLWAPDIRYFNGKYYLYYVVTQTNMSPERHDNAIGVATAPTPAGPWRDSGAPVVGPRRVGPDNYKWTFDPNQFTDVDGTRYLYYGSYYGGIWVTQLSEDGTTAVGEPTMVAIDNRYEGSYVMRRGGWYYLFASSADCCAGPVTGYSVFTGRSRSPRGPFEDRQGVSMTASRVGGSIVVTPNGNKWVGPGHNAVVTDVAGQDWFVYHAINRRDPYLDEPYGVNERPMLLDRLDWINGWPTVRAGRWASAGRQQSPVTRGAVYDEFDGRESLGGEWVAGPGWAVASGREGEFAKQRQDSCQTSVLRSTSEPADDRRVEADLRSGAEVGGTAGLVSAWRQDTGVISWLRPGARTLQTDVVRNGTVVRSESSPLPANFVFTEWHNVATSIRNRRVVTTVTDARLHDPQATTTLRLPRGFGDRGKVGVASRCGTVAADNISGAQLFTPVRRRVANPRVGEVRPAYSDRFRDGTLEPAWSWVRDPDGREANGEYIWPTQNADINRDENDASVLLRDAPDGAYTVTTKLAIDLGVQTERNFQQAGLIVFANSDRYLKLVHAALWNTRQTEFAKEMPYGGRIAYGGMLVGPPDATTWLRVSHRIDPDNGEHEYQAATSRDGRNWVWGGVWTMPARTDPRIGLISMGGDGSDEKATARFEYFRVTSP